MQVGMTVEDPIRHKRIQLFGEKPWSYVLNCYVGSIAASIRSLRHQTHTSLTVPFLESSQCLFVKAFTSFVESVSPVLASPERFGVTRFAP